jgi:hypothetical protein
LPPPSKLSDAEQARRDWHKAESPGVRRGSSHQQ